MKSKIVLLAVLTLFLTSCSKRWCYTRYPVSVDSIYKYVTKDSIVIKDTTIYIHLPGEVVIDSVEIPCPDPGPAYIPKRVTAETSLARAEAWWQYPNIQLRLVQKDSTIETRLRGAIIERNHYKSLYEKMTVNPEPVKVIPKIYKVSLWLCIGAIVAFAIWVFIKYKVKILSLIK